tara:strand:- start:2028 stop:2261 length:234 start_codon:yes stop_codon:yes gene_type:complete
MPSINTKNMSFEKAIRIFRKKVENAGIKDSVREKEYYEKPNWKRRRKLKSAIRRQEREKAKEEAYWKDYRKLHKRRN